MQSWATQARTAWSGGRGRRGEASGRHRRPRPRGPGSCLPVSWPCLWGKLEVPEKQKDGQRAPHSPHRASMRTRGWEATAVSVLSALHVSENNAPLSRSTGPSLWGWGESPGTQKYASLKTSTSRWVRLRPAASGSIPECVPKPTLPGREPSVRPSGNCDAECSRPAISRHR